MAPNASGDDSKTAATTQAPKTPAPAKPTKPSPPAKPTGPGSEEYVLVKVPTKYATVGVKQPDGRIVDYKAGEQAWMPPDQAEAIGAEEA